VVTHNQLKKSMKSENYSGRTPVGLVLISFRKIELRWHLDASLAINTAIRLASEIRVATRAFMQVFLYLKHFPPAGDWLHEGTTKAVHGLATGLAACGAEVTVLCEGDRTTQHQAPAGYTIACFKRSRWSRSSAPSFWVSTELQTFLQRKASPHSSLVILNGVFHKSVYALSRFLRHAQIPYIVAPHDPYHPSIFQTNRYLKLPYWHLLEKVMLQQASAVQILDERHEQWLHYLRVNTPTIAVPNGFEPSDVIDPRLIQWGDSAHTAQLYYLGRVDQHNKGLDILIHATATIPPHQAVQLTIQGPDWGDRAALEAQANTLNATHPVQFLDADFAQSAALLAAQYDVFCLTSRFEGFGLVALEAMLAGRVLLVSEVAGIAPHVLASGCGVVVEPTVAGVQQGIQQLLQVRSQWPDMGQRGRQYVLEHLRWQSIAAKALSAYHATLNHPSHQLALSPG
jgi:glycosyltransferase involved in cell wall biosynthesis